MPAKYFASFLRFELNHLPGPLPILAHLHKGTLYILNTKNLKSKSIIYHWKSKSPLEQWFYISHQYSSLISTSLYAYSKYCFDIQLFFIRNCQLTNCPSRTCILIDIKKYLFLNYPCNFESIKTHDDNTAHDGRVSVQLSAKRPIIIL